MNTANMHMLKSVALMLSVCNCNKAYRCQQCLMHCNASATALLKNMQTRGERLTVICVACMYTHAASLLDPGRQSPADAAVAGTSVVDSALVLAVVAPSSRINRTASKSSLESWRALPLRRRLRRCAFFSSFAKRFFSSFKRCCSPLRSPMALFSDAKLPPPVPGNCNCAANACTAEWAVDGGAPAAGLVPVGAGLSDMVLPTPRCGSNAGQGGWQKTLRHAGYQHHDPCAVAIDVTMEQGRHLRLLLTRVMADVAVALRAAKKHKTMHLLAHPNA